MPAVARIEVEIDEQGAVIGAQRVEGALTKVGTKGNVVMTELRKQQLQANQASQLFSRTLGIQLPRALDNVIAKSKLIGPVMSAAFNIAVVAGLAFALANLIPRIKAWTEEIAGFGEAAKKILADVKEANDKLLTSFEDVAVGLVKLSLVQQAFVEAQHQAIEADKNRAAALDLLLGPFGSLLPVQALAIAGLVKYGGAAHKANEETERWRKALETINQRLKELREAGGEAARGVTELADGFKKLQPIQFQTLSEGDRLLIKLTEDLERAAQAQREFEKLQLEGGQLIEELARRRFEATSTAEERIRAEYEETMRRLEELARAGAVTWEQFEKARADATAIQTAEIDRIRQTAADEELRRQEEIAQQNQRKVEEMAAVWGEFVDQMIHGAQSWKDFFIGMLRALLARFLKFVGEMVIAWIMGLKTMAEIWEELKKKLPGGGGFTINFGFSPPSFQHGGLVDDVMRRAQAIHSADGRLLAMLHQGEAVLNAGATRMLGAARIQALNRAGGPSTALGVIGTPPSFQSGGIVGPAAAAGPVNVTVNVFPAPGMNPEQVANFTIRKLKRELRDTGLRLGR